MDTQPDIQAVGRVAQILALFQAAEPELSVADIAGRLGLNRTTAHRYVASLVAAGLLERGERNGSFAPGQLLSHVGALALGRRKVIKLAPPYLRDLANLIETTALLSLWGTSGPVVSMVEEHDNHGVLVTIRAGLQLPLSASQAVAFLAFLPDQLFAQRLLANLPVEERGALEVRIQTVRTTGVCMPYDSRRGIHTVAAPVFGDTGLCATIAVVGTERMVPGESNMRQALEVRHAAYRLTCALGGEWPEGIPYDPTRLG